MKARRSKIISGASLADFAGVRGENCTTRSRKTNIQHCRTARSCINAKTKDRMRSEARFWSAERCSFYVTGSGLGSYSEHGRAPLARATNSRPARIDTRAPSRLAPLTSPSHRRGGGSQQPPHRSATAHSNQTYIVNRTTNAQAPQAMTRRRKN